MLHDVIRCGCRGVGSPQKKEKKKEKKREKKREKKEYISLPKGLNTKLGNNVKTPTRATARQNNNNMTRATREDPDQLGHRPRPIRVFAMSSLNSWRHKTSACGDSGQIGPMPRPISVRAGRKGNSIGPVVFRLIYSNTMSTKAQGLGPHRTYHSKVE